MTENLKAVNQNSDTVTLNFECALAIAEAEKRLQLLVVSLRRTDIEFFWIMSGKRRFYLTTRNLRTHLIEADGFLTKLDDQRTQVNGDIHGDPIMSTLVGLIVVIVLASLLAVFLTGSLLSVIAGVAALGAAALYYSGSQRQTHESQLQMAKMIRDALSQA